tara:strand:- start:66 stop:899 length:834 start_codon:yes stop_codon:yes gene_type:complete
MKNIFIMCAGRTGSTLLTGHFACDENICNVWEFWAMHTPHFWRTIKSIKKAGNGDLPKSFVEFMSNVYDVSPTNLRGLKATRAEFPYTLNMLSDAIEVLEKNTNFKYFMHKNIHHANKLGGWTQEDIIKMADVVIVNYRKSILDCWISNVRASESNIWLSKEYVKDYDQRIYFNASNFIEYAKGYRAAYENIKNKIKKHNKQHLVIEYETLCKQPDSCKYIADKLKGIGISDIAIIKPDMVKQSTPREHYDDTFKEYHAEKFREQYSEIKKYTSYKF